jgi:hypothetical protein
MLVYGPNLIKLPYFVKKLKIYLQFGAKIFEFIALDKANLIFAIRLKR